MHTAFATRQDGAALVVGLILLVVVTVLAISGMNTANTELTIARNDQNYENAFQAAETGLEIALSQPAFPSTGMDVDVPEINANDSVVVRVEYEEMTPVVDEAYSMGVGSGIAAHHFVATAEAESKRAGTAGGATDRDASAVHRQAFYIIGPGGSSL